MTLKRRAEILADIFFVCPFAVFRLVFHGFCVVMSSYLFISIQADKAVAEEKLEVAKPALAEAEAALQTIKPAHISSVRKLQKPPNLIQRIMDAVLILFNNRLDPVTMDLERNWIKPSWGESLKLMSQSGFLSGLINFQKVRVNVTSSYYMN